MSDTTGGIEGTVLSLEGLPIMADVGIPDLGVSARTGADGTFALSEIPPGPHVVMAAALGYEGASQTAEVAAGEVSQVSFALKASALEGVAYSRVLGPISGKFFCGFGTGAVSGPCKIAGFADESNPVETTWQQVTQGENNIFEFRTIIEKNKTVASDQIKSIVVEVKWEPTSAGSRWLQSTIEDLPSSPGARNTSEPKFARASGLGPLKMTVTPGVANEGQTAMPVQRPGFAIGVFPTVDPASPKVTNPTNNKDILVGASAYTEQSFQIWITLFYNGPAPADYTVLK